MIRLVDRQKVFHELVLHFGIFNALTVDFKGGFTGLGRDQNGDNLIVVCEGTAGDEDAFAPLTGFWIFFLAAGMEFSFSFALLWTFPPEMDSRQPQSVCDGLVKIANLAVKAFLFQSFCLMSKERDD
ncbi:hypothetical protein [Allobaculum sp. Allo2]|uniref:hypothetical protein n=1 Tax=Allobaculum sp. Allo2 TaxID=2853432 RepID=UPI001F60C2DC|nr:hypothetical protein [Allobaculum sp. Allo2]UNT93116.1 hypothetical protein KWG61_14020 [Allobaculum sp. Allo2]